MDQKSNEKIDEEYICTVYNVRQGENAGEHGDYAFAMYTAEDGSKKPITFSCEPPCWNENKNPSEGDVVILEKVHQKRIKNNKFVWVAEEAKLRTLKK